MPGTREHGAHDFAWEVHPEQHADRRCPFDRRVVVVTVAVRLAPRGEEPLLLDVHVHDLCDERTRDRVLQEPERLVFKPRDGQGGQGVVVGPAADGREIADARRAIEEDPGGWIVQEVISLSTCPVVVDGHLEPRHLDLRVVTEGIERDAEASLLAQLGSSHGQGYLFSRPVAADRVPDLLGAPDLV